MMDFPYIYLHYTKMYRKSYTKTRSLNFTVNSTPTVRSTPRGYVPLTAGDAQFTTYCGCF